MEKICQRALTKRKLVHHINIRLAILYCKKTHKKQITNKTVKNMEGILFMGKVSILIRKL